MGRFAPVNPGRGLICIGRDVFRLAPGGGYQIDIPARGSLVAHQPTDKRDLPAIRRPARHRDLQTVQRARSVFRVEDGSRRAAIQLLGIELCHPPIVFSGRRCSYVGQLPAVGCPVVFINMELGRGDLTHFAGCGFDSGDALDFEALDPDNTRRRLHRSQRACRPGGAFDVQARDMQAVGGKSQAGDSAMQVG